jgi:hypothetical protein
MATMCWPDRWNLMVSLREEYGKEGKVVNKF